LIYSIAQAETATIIANTPLYQRPSVYSKTLSELYAGNRVDVTSRVGSWKKVTLDDQTVGWVRSYRVRSGISSTTVVNEEPSDSGGFLSGLAQLSRKASGLFSSEKKSYSFQRTATIGVRGLSEEQIKNAQPNLGELNKMETFRSSKKSARRFAKEGKLHAIKLAHMPASEVEQ
jgi:hypothetical protein